MNDNKKFWNRFAFLYEKVQRAGKKSKKFYKILEGKVSEQLNEDMVVLELAMGPAMLTEQIGKHCKKLIATDFSYKMVEQAKKKNLPANVIIEQADATNLSYKDKSFQAVVIANALHIMPDPVKAIAEIKRVLTDDGIIIAPTYTRKKSENKLKLAIMSTVGFKRYFPWSDRLYKEFLVKQNLEIVYSEIIPWSDFPESFVVCKKVTP